MRKILLVVSLISALLLAGCNSNEEIENDNLLPDVDNSQQEEVMDNNPNLENKDSDDDGILPDDENITQEEIDDGQDLENEESNIKI